jgi:hypothetical protein
MVVSVTPFALLSFFHLVNFLLCFSCLPRPLLRDPRDPSELVSGSEAETVLEAEEGGGDADCERKEEEGEGEMGMERESDDNAAFNAGNTVRAAADARCVR